jgi:hypothetical protein
LLETAESDLQLKLKLEEISNASRSSIDPDAEHAASPDWSDASIDT